MCAKVVNLKAERQRRRARTGWSIEEIEKAAKARREYHERSQVPEPPNLVSGDRGELLKELDDDEQDD